MPSQTVAMDPYRDFSMEVSIGKTNLNLDSPLNVELAEGNRFHQGRIQ